MIKVDKVKDTLSASIATEFIQLFLTYKMKSYEKCYPLKVLLYERNILLLLKNSSVKRKIKLPNS